MAMEKKFHNKLSLLILTQLTSKTSLNHVSLFVCCSIYYIHSLYMTGPTFSVSWYLYFMYLLIHKGFTGHFCAEISNTFVKFWSRKHLNLEDGFPWTTISWMLTESKKVNITPQNVISLNARQWDIWMCNRDLADIPMQEASIIF